jgi:hypothetical protein
MMRIILILIILFAPVISVSHALLSLPSDILIDPSNPTTAFSKDIQQYFSVSANVNNSGCKKSQMYMLTMLIYRNAVDNKIVGTYRAKNESSLCWVDLISYSDKLLPDPTAPAWAIPKAGENTWCNVDGLRNPLLCAFFAS